MIRQFKPFNRLKLVCRDVFQQKRKYKRAHTHTHNITHTFSQVDLFYLLSDE